MSAIVDPPVARPEVIHEPIASSAFGIVEKPLSTWERIRNVGALRKFALLVALAVTWELYARSLANPLIFPTFSATVVAFVLLAVLVVAAVSYAEGRLLLGRAPATGTVSLSGSTLSQQELSWRTALALGYVIICMFGVAAIALFFSTLTRSAIGAALGTIGVLVASTVLLGLDAAGALHPFLPTRYWLAFVDLFRDPILWRDVVRGLEVQLGYLTVFTLAAWANFGTKDIDD